MREHGALTVPPSPYSGRSKLICRAVAVPLQLLPNQTMSERQESFREDVRFKVLRILENHPEYSQREIAEALGVSLGGVNYCLKAMVEKGHVKVGNFRQSDNKLRYVYALTPSGIAERAMLAGRFLQRKMREYDAIRAEIEALTSEQGQGIDMPVALVRDDRQRG